MKYRLLDAHIKSIAYTLDFEFVIQDLWIGIFWKKDVEVLHIYICLFPTLVFHWIFDWFKIQ
jgi:hypothetical protein